MEVFGSVSGGLLEYNVYEGGNALGLDTFADEDAMFRDCRIKLRVGRPSRFPS